jgi:hypothetical protein
MKKIEKASEVRLGNLYKEGNDFKEIDFTDLNGLLMGFDEWKLDPIPLTEEWLLKFGFEITKNFQTKDRFQTHKKDGIIWFEYGYIRVELKYVHELQNLYFALFGEELTIKQQEKPKETDTYPCPQCQGGGCPYCCGYGTIPK